MSISIVLEMRYNSFIC